MNEGRLTGAGLVLGWGTENNLVAPFLKLIEHVADITFRPAIIIGKNDANAVSTGDAKSNEAEGESGIDLHGE